MKAAPVILYPLHGCSGVIHVNERESLIMQARLRETLRKNWNEPGVKAIIELLEQRTARTQREAIQRGAGPHEAGQAYGLTEFLGLLHGIVMSSEKTPPKVE